MIVGLDVHGEVKLMSAHTCLLPGRSDVKAKNPQLTDIPQIASLQKWKNGCHKDLPALLAMPLASLLVTICLLLWMVQNAITTNKSDSLVGGKWFLSSVT